MADQQGYQDDGEPSEVSIGDGERHHGEAVGEVRLEQDGGEQTVAEGGGGRDDKDNLMMMMVMMMRVMTTWGQGCRRGRGGGRRL